MPYLESTYELAEAIADMVGIYGCGPTGDHPSDCPCRICFVDGMQHRIEAAQNERRVMPSAWG